MLIPDIAHISRFRIVIPRESTTSGDEVFEAENYEQLCAKLIKAHTHGTRYIHKQNQELKNLRDLLQQVLALVAALGKCRNRLGVEAESILTELSDLIAKSN